MKRILIITLGFWTGLAAAQMDTRGAKASPHNFSVVGSMATGGFSIGAGYEYMYDASTGVGGQLRTFSKKTPSTSVPTASNGYMIVGATLGHHFFKGKWDLAFTPSFNIISIDSYHKPPDSTTTMGPGLGISLLWALTDHVSLGFSYEDYWVWFEDAYKGQIISDMGIKVKASF